MPRIIWWPFQITAVLVSYSGFALSALAVVRLHRGHAGSVLIAYAMSVFLVLAASAALIEVLIQRNGAVPVPHALFYVISVALPYQWRADVLFRSASSAIPALHFYSACSATPALYLSGPAASAIPALGPSGPTFGV